MIEKAVPLKSLEQAIACLRQGGVVAIPTETYYGLAVDPFNQDALTRLYQLKKRVESKPILTLIDDPGQLSLLAHSVPPLAERVMTRFWPGPVTIVFPGRPDLPPALIAGTSTVGVRIPDHPVPRLLARSFGRPITGTSANISGKPAATTTEEVRRYFADGIDCIIEGGKTPGGMGSTVVGFDGAGDLFLIRKGVIDYSLIMDDISSPE